MEKWTRAFYQPNRPLEDNYATACPAHIALSEQAAEEGMVLLKNEQNLLPLDKNTPIAPFGKGIFDMVTGGGGSGEVHAPFVTTLAEGIVKCGGTLFEGLEEYYEKQVRTQYGQGVKPGMTVESAVPQQLLEDARKVTDTALIALSRFSGEGWDRQGGIWDDPEGNFWGEEESMPRQAQRIYPDGDFYLTKAEKALVSAVTQAFPKVVVVLNVGGVVDTAWIRDDAGIGGALLMGQAGMDGGTAAARLLFGDANPSGKLPDTFARVLEDYPSTEGFHTSPWYVEYTEDIYVGYRYFETIPGAAQRVVYPFGYGLSYTTFAQQAVSVADEEDALIFTVKIENTGSSAGREATGIYCRAPQGQLGRPARELAAFGKTKLLAPGESDYLILRIPYRQLAAFDDAGKIQKNALVLEQGEYHFYLGSNVRESAEIDYIFTMMNDLVIEQLSDALKPRALTKRMRPDGSFEAVNSDEPVSSDESLAIMNACIFEKLPADQVEALFPARRERGRFRFGERIKPGAHPLSAVVSGEITMDEFLDQLSDDDLIALTGGTPNTGVANTCGFGGLEEYGVPAVMTADGPAGVRIDPVCGVRTTAWPTATLLASTWNTRLIGKVGEAAAKELKENNLHVWLAPAMNIHRNPLCGRNFEYFSEDPLLTGKMAAAEVRGIQSQGVSACIKHFAANNKETNRKNSDSRVSLRALREIYLRGFEIAVKEGHPRTLMSSYNAVNAQRASESRDLLTQILRNEWGYDGAVTTDWWTRGEQYKEILAGNDVKMATGFPERVRRAMDEGALTRDDVKACARRVLELICRLD